MVFENKDIVCFFERAFILLVVFLVAVTIMCLLFEGAEMDFKFYVGVVTGWSLVCFSYLSLTEPKTNN